MSQLKIREMPQDERPREKLLARGPDALTNAELIAILLRTGRRGMNVVEVARELLDKYKSFAELSRCSVKELSEIKGIGPAKALELVAAFNLGKRFAQEPLSQQKLDSPELIHELLGGEMRMLRTESLRVVLLDTRYRLMRVESVSTGSMNESIAHPARNFSACNHLLRLRSDRRAQSPVRRLVAQPDGSQPDETSGRSCGAVANQIARSHHHRRALGGKPGIFQF